MKEQQMNRADMQLVRYVLALVWLVTGALSFGLYPVDDSLAMLQPLGVSRSLALLILYAGATADVAMGVLTLSLPRRCLWSLQILLIVSYTLLATWLVPQQWLHPFGPLLKNFPILLLLWLLYRYDDAPQGRAA
jgi:hypothetical protein